MSKYTGFVRVLLRAWLRGRRLLAATRRSRNLRQVAVRQLSICTQYHHCLFLLSYRSPNHFLSRVNTQLHGAYDSHHTHTQPRREYSCSRPCLNNGVCQRNVVGSACLCLPGFSGKWCEQAMNTTLSTSFSEALTSGGSLDNATTESVSPATLNLTAAHNPCDINPCQFDGNARIYY